MNPSRKKTFLMIGVGVATFAAVGGAIWMLAFGPTRYVDPIKGFSIAFPQDWEFHEGGPDGASVLGSRSLGIAEGSRRAAVNVIVESLDPPVDSPAFRRQGIRIHAGMLPDYMPIGEGIERLGKVEAPWILYTYVAGPKEKRFQAWQFYLARGSRGYVITCTSEVESFEKFRPDFEEIARSFRFE